MSKAKQVKDKIKHAMRNWKEIGNREIQAYLLLLAEAIEELGEPPKVEKPTQAVFYEDRGTDRNMH